MTEHLKLANPLAQGVPNFVQTSTAKQIMLSADMIRAQQRPAMSMVCGVPGCGKTITLEMLLEADPDARMISIAPSEGGAFSIAEIIVSKLALGIKIKGRTIASLRYEIGQFLKYAGLADGG
ncbi:MAG: hypothetical protein ACK5LJ_07725 [Paracoccus sp. (in: a-proteobacteria)]